MVEKAMKNKLIMGAGVAAVSVVAVLGIVAAHRFIASGHQQKQQQGELQSLETPVNSSDLLDLVSGGKGHKKNSGGSMDLKALSKSVEKLDAALGKAEDKEKFFKTMMKNAEKLRKNLNGNVKDLKKNLEVSNDVIKSDMIKEGKANEDADWSKKNNEYSKKAKDTLPSAVKNYKDELKKAQDALAGVSGSNSCPEIAEAIKTALNLLVTAKENRAEHFAMVYTAEHVPMSSVVSDFDRACETETDNVTRSLIQKALTLSNGPVKHLEDMKKKCEVNRNNVANVNTGILFNHINTGHLAAYQALLNEFENGEIWKIIQAFRVIKQVNEFVGKASSTVSNEAMQIQTKFNQANKAFNSIIEDLAKVKTSMEKDDAASLKAGKPVNYVKVIAKTEKTIMALKAGGGK